MPIHRRQHLNFNFQLLSWLQVESHQFRRLLKSTNLSHLSFGALKMSAFLVPPTEIYIDQSDYYLLPSRETLAPRNV